MDERWRIFRFRVKREERGRRKIICSDIQRCRLIALIRRYQPSSWKNEGMVANLHRNGVDQRTANELDSFYNELKAALFVTVSECVISWSICVPSFRKYAIYGGTRRRGIIDRDEPEGKGMEGRVN